MSTALPPSDGDRPAEGESTEAAGAPAEGSGTAAPQAPGGATAGATRTPRSGGSATARTQKTTQRATGKSPTAKSTAAKATPAQATPANATPDKATEASSGDDAATPARKPPAKKTTTPRTRRTTAKPAPIAPEGEAPDIMDATLGAREPLARTTGSSRSRSASARDTSTSPAEPLIEENSATTDATGAGATTRLPSAEELYGRRGPGGSDVPASQAAAASAETRTERLPADTTDTDQEAAVDTTKARETGDEPTDATESAAAPAAATAAGPIATPQQPTHGRTVGDLADRLDDSRFFSSLFDFTFTNYVTRKLAGPVYVVGLVLIALGIIVGFANSLTSAIATHAPIGAFVFLFGVLITLVGAMLSVLLLRVGIEVFCAIIEIAQNTRRRRPPGE